MMENRIDCKKYRFGFYLYFVNNTIKVYFYFTLILSCVSHIGQVCAKFHTFFSYFDGFTVYTWEYNMI